MQQSGEQRHGVWTRVWPFWRDAPSHDGGRAGHGTDGDDDLLHSLLSAKVVVLGYVCVGVHRDALDGTPSLSVYMVVVYGVVIDHGWPRTKWHLLHVVLCRETARRCVCGDGVKVGGWWSRAAAFLTAAA